MGFKHVALGLYIPQPLISTLLIKAALTRLEIKNSVWVLEPFSNILTGILYCALGPKFPLRAGEAVLAYQVLIRYLRAEYFSMQLYLEHFGPEVRIVSTILGRGLI